MGKKASEAFSIKFIFALIVPLCLASIGGTAAMLWQMQPTIAAHSERLEELDKKATSAQQHASAANERQVEIRVRMTRMEEKLDYLVREAEKEAAE